MNVSAVSAASVMQIKPECAEGRGPDNDGDADDLAAPAAAPVKATPALDTGQLVDISA